MTIPRVMLLVTVYNYSLASVFSFTIHFLKNLISRETITLFFFSIYYKVAYHIKCTQVQWMKRRINGIFQNIQQTCWYQMVFQSIYLTQNSTIHKWCLGAKIIITILYGRFHMREISQHYGKMNHLPSKHNIIQYGNIYYYFKGQFNPNY